MSKATFHNYDSKLPPQKTELEREREREERVDSGKVEERVNLPKRNCRQSRGWTTRSSKGYIPIACCHILKSLIIYY